MYSGQAVNSCKRYAGNHWCSHGCIALWLGRPVIFCNSLRTQELWDDLLISVGLPKLESLEKIFFR